jgi:broad specificity phosphatase PhoE
MGAIYLVRHGQAAFATHHYDRLTRIGYTQARLLGGFFACRSGQIRRGSVRSVNQGQLRVHL